MAPSEKHIANPPLKRRRKPGRPSVGGAAEDIRLLILLAAKAVYAEYGYQGTTVARILQEAKVSRSTFYRHFSDCHQVVDEIIENACNELLGAVVQAAMVEKTTLKRGQAGIRAYFNWCDEVGSLASAIYGEMNLAESPAQKHRNRIVASFVNLVHEQSDISGEQKLEPLFYDTLVRSIEHLVHSVFAPSDCGADEAKRRTVIAERILLAALAEPEDSGSVPRLSELAMG